MPNLRNRYSRLLKGINAQGFFSPTGSNTSSAAATTTIEAFLAAGVEGSIGIFNASNNQAVAIASALTAGTKYYIAQVVDGLIKKSVEFDGGNVELTGSDFTAPVFQQVVIGNNGTTGDLNIDIAGGLQEFVARVNELTPASQPFPSLEGRAVVRSSSGVNDYDVANRIVKDINGVFDYEENEDDKGIVAEVLTNGNSAAFTNAAATSGIHYPGNTQIIVTDAQDLAVGEYIVFAAAGAGSADEPTFQVIEQNTGGSVESIVLDRPLTVEIASATAVTNKAYDPADTAADSVGIRILSTSEDVVFSVGVSEDLAGADVNTVTEWIQGSGAPWQVALIERETQVFAGDTVQNIAFAEDYGQPTSFVNENADASVATNQYDLLYIKYKKETPSMGYPNENTHAFGYIILGTIGVATVLGTTF